VARWTPSEKPQTGRDSEQCKKLASGGGYSQRGTFELNLGEFVANIQAAAEEHSTR
jgi:hypothetical protein